MGCQSGDSLYLQAPRNISIGSVKKKLASIDDIQTPPEGINQLGQGK
jgi:hypothetical protein